MDRSVVQAVGCSLRYSRPPSPFSRSEYFLAKFPDRRSYVPSCADWVRSPLFVEACEPSIFSEAVSDKKTRLLEAGLLLAVPICVAVTALFAVFASARL